MCLMQSVLLLLSLLCTATVGTEIQRIVQGPTDTQVLLGDTTVLTCRVQWQKGTVQWAKDGTGMGFDRDLPYVNRHSMIGLGSEGDFHLQISDVQLSDDATYQCQVKPTATQPKLMSDMAKLTVLVAPSLPQLSARKLSGRLSGVVGVQINSTCTSSGGKPPARLGWALTKNADGSEIVRWVAKIDTEMNSQIASDDSFSRVHVSETTVKIDQLYRIASHIRRPLGPIDEADRVLLSCVVDANPIDHLAIVWKKNGELIRGAQTDTLPLTELRREDDGAEFQCHATNKVGSATGHIRLSVRYGPRFVSRSVRLAVDIGDSATFVCLAVGNPTPSIRWTKRGFPGTVLSKANNLTIENVQQWHRGEYQCTANVRGFEPQVLVSSLRIRGPPLVSAISSTVHATSGSSAVLHCKVRGLPAPSDISWFRAGVYLDVAQLSGRYKVTQQAVNNGVESVLVIDPLESDDFNVFNCTGSNQLGVRSVRIKLIPIDTMPIYLAIPAGILICAFMLMLILTVLLRRRRLCASKSSRYSDDHSDVTVKVEPMDGRRYIDDMPNMYSPTPMDAVDFMSATSDYLPIPQCNPDLDYLYHHPSSSSSSVINGRCHPATVDCCVQPAVCYDSFAHGRPTVLTADLYYPLEGVAPLETLTEVPTTADDGHVGRLYGRCLPVHRRIGSPNDRPTSRTSTHV